MAAVGGLSVCTEYNMRTEYALTFIYIKVLNIYLFILFKGLPPLLF